MSNVKEKVIIEIYPSAFESLYELDYPFVCSLQFVLSLPPSRRPSRSDHVDIEM